MRNIQTAQQQQLTGKYRQGTHSTKMGADKWAENAENAPIFFCPSPSLGFHLEKASSGVRFAWWDFKGIKKNS